MRHTPAVYECTAEIPTMEQLFPGMEITAAPHMSAMMGTNLRAAEYDRQPAENRRGGLLIGSATT